MFFVQQAPGSTSPHKLSIVLFCGEIEPFALQSFNVDYDFVFVAYSGSGLMQ
jgi:hypothetical protein